MFCGHHNAMTALEHLYDKHNGKKKIVREQY